MTDLLGSASPGYAAGPVSQLRRIAAVTGRNVEAAKHLSYLWVLLSGIFEPAFYLFAIGVGVGSLVGTITVDGTEVDYLFFVAPAMLASAVMNGAVSESTFNFFTKLRLMGLYDSTACTPVAARELVLGEVLWSMTRGAVHAVPFLLFLRFLGIVETVHLPLLFAVTLLVGMAFGTLGIAISTLLRNTQDFDGVNLVTFSMFMFSGTFTPISDYPAPVEFLAALTPLWHAVALTRGVAGGDISTALLLHVAYLVAVIVVATVVAGHRIENMLRP